jgi:hypothetical protein
VRLKASRERLSKFRDRHEHALLLNNKLLRTETPSQCVPWAAYHRHLGGCVQPRPSHSQFIDWMH